MDDNYDDPEQDQWRGLRLAEAFEEYDLRTLAGLTADQRAAQARAREHLAEYVDDLWEDAKAEGLDPAIRPEWNVVAGMRDLTIALRETAQRAQEEADDPEPFRDVMLSFPRQSMDKLNRRAEKHRKNHPLPWDN